MTRAMALATLLPDVAGIPDGLVVTGLTLDSRDVRPGDAFVAIGGGKSRGGAYSDIDMIFTADGDYRHKDGTPYAATRV